MQVGIAFLLFELFPQVRQATQAAAPVQGTAELIDTGNLLIINLYAYDLANRRPNYSDLQRALADACRLLSGTLPRWAAERTMLRVAAYVFGTSTGTACPVKVDKVRRIISAVWQGSEPMRAAQLTVYEQAYSPVPNRDGRARNDHCTARYIDAVRHALAQRRGAVQSQRNANRFEVGGRPGSSTEGAGANTRASPASSHQTALMRWEEEQKRQCEHCARFGVAGRIQGRQYAIHSEWECPFMQNYDTFKMCTWRQLIKCAPPGTAQREVEQEFRRHCVADPEFARRWNKYCGKSPCSPTRL